MEENIFNQSNHLSINEIVKVQLQATTKWAKFLGIMGFIFCGLIAIVAFFAGSLFASLNKLSPATNPEMPANVFSGAFGYFIGAIYLGIAVLYFFPTLYLYRFADKMKIALQNDDQFNLESAFLNLTKMFRFVGVLTIIVVGFYALIFLGVIMVAVLAR